jgi:glycosyltransferase involved in cell wall biosynthesis
VCSQGGPGELDEEFEKLGCEIYRLPKPSNPYATARALGCLLRDAPHDIIHSQKGYGSGGFAVAAARCGIPIVVSFHSAQSNVRKEWEAHLPQRLLRRGWLAWNRWQMRRHVDVFVGHSETNISSFEPSWREDPSRYKVIYNGFNFPDNLLARSQVRKEMGIGEEETVLLHVGSFRPEKDHDSLLEIARRVFEVRENGVLILVGEGGLRSEAERRATDLGLHGRVRFEGAQRDVWRYYAAADILVFPSTTEGFGNVLVEAQAAGLPLVASDIPAHREAVAPEQHRFLFPTGDADAAVSLVGGQLEAANKCHNQWVDRSRDFVRLRFSAVTTSEQLASLYSRVVGA